MWIQSGPLCFLLPSLFSPNIQRNPSASFTKGGIFSPEKPSKEVRLDPSTSGVVQIVEKTLGPPTPTDGFTEQQHLLKRENAVGDLIYCQKESVDLPSKDPPQVCAAKEGVASVSVHQNHCRPTPINDSSMPSASPSIGTPALAFIAADPSLFEKELLPHSLILSPGNPKVASPFRPVVPPSSIPSKRSPAINPLPLKAKSLPKLLKPFPKHFVRKKTSFINSWSTIVNPDLLENCCVNIQIPGLFSEKGEAPLRIVSLSPIQILTPGL